MATLPATTPNEPPPDLMRRGEELKRAGDFAGAIAAYLSAAEESEIPAAPLCLQLARCYAKTGDAAQACR